MERVTGVRGVESMAEPRAAVRFTIADLEVMPDDEWRRYEIIDGELFVSKAPRIEHQAVCYRFAMWLGTWNDQTGLGEVLPGPGLIFGEADSVIPDLVWVSRERLALIAGDDGHLHGAP